MNNHIFYINPFYSGENDIVIAVSILQFNNGHSHIAIYNRRYVVVHKDKITCHLFKEVIQAIKTLPDTPQEYTPYIDFISGNILKVIK